VSFAVSKLENFTYGDYATWPEDERWELVEGRPFQMSPAPGRRHQRVVVELVKQIAVLLTGESCEVYTAPFDVRLPDGEESDEEASTVVQPDVVVVCDEKKLDERGCRGAPDFIVEVASPSTAARDQIQKAALYEKHGVREYWVVHPVDGILTVRLLDSNGRYGSVTFYEGRGKRPVETLPGLEIDLDAVFQ